MNIKHANRQLIEDYLRAIESGATGEALARFYTEDAEQIEWPNRLNPAGGRSDLARLLKRAESASSLIKDQRYELHSLLAQEDQVAVEATWTGVLIVPLETLPAGSALKAHFAMFFDLREGQIYRQRNYDCFEPW
ncbi:MAG: nuclear transport factor 2 family protein [Pirellulales bacterium]